MIISEYYVKKPWTKFERQAAVSRMLREKSAYVLPIRLDDTEVLWEVGPHIPVPCPHRLSADSVTRV